MDVTELLANPLRTGVQRVVRELIRHWPHADLTLHLARFSSGIGLRRLPDSARPLLADETAETRELSPAQLRTRLAAIVDAAEPQPLPSPAVIFVPEVFYNAARCRYYRDLVVDQNTSVALLCYDFLPFSHPELFNFTSKLPLMWYPWLTRSATQVGFISQQTRNDYVAHVHRGRQSANLGPVLPLGADGLLLEKQSWRPDRKTFTVLGTIDGRKNQHLVVEAFLELWRSGRDTPLVVIGRANAGVDVNLLHEARNFPQFQWLEDASDDSVATILRRTRATIYASSAEGFGLPPIESLNAGIPVIVSAHIPSVAQLGSAGQVHLTEVTKTQVADAVTRLTPDAAARALWTEAAGLRLTGWKSFASQTAYWCRDIGAVRSSLPLH